MVARPWSSSRLSCGERLLLRCDGKAGNSFPKKQGKDPSSQARRRKRENPGGFSRQEHWSGFPFPSPGDLLNPGIKPGSPASQADSLPSEPPGKPKNTGVGSLSLLQGIFSTQGSNPGLPHCRQILYQLSHKESLSLSLSLYSTRNSTQYSVMTYMGKTSKNSMDIFITDSLAVPQK